MISSFDSIKNKFDDSVFEVYIKHLRRIKDELGIKPNDPRVVYSLREDRLNFTVGQRYCFNLYLNESKGTFGVISKQQLLENSEPYDGNPPQPYYNYYSKFTPSESEWDSVVEAIKDELNRTSKSGFRKNNDPDFENFVFKKGSNQISNQVKMTTPLNQILYGPPGTGKTYSTINRVLSIIESKSEEELHCEPREDLIKRFHSYQKAGQVVFTTFHQSLGYEDFIEGLKPSEKAGVISYNVEDGLFKQMAYKALFACLQKGAKPLVEDYQHFDNLYSAFLNHLEIKIETSKEEVLLELKSKGYYLIVESIEEDVVVTRGKLAQNSARIEKEKVKLLYKKFESADEIKNVVADIRGVGPGLGWSSNYFGIFKELKRFEKEDWDRKELVDEIKNNYTDYKRIKEFVKELQPEDLSQIKAGDSLGIDSFVLVIDEINRGNVSSIFGELITLIETSKRIGHEEAIQIKLPYSKTEFGVPLNLYIIGTMNTADRSVEALDVALRRRFSFEFMGPQYDLVQLQHRIEGIDMTAAELLKIINTRITYLKDEDHQIGHSYFMNVYSKEALAITFNKNIIPLLQEYFYNDYGKIRLILGRGFVEKKDDWKPEFASDDEVFSSVTYTINPITPDNILEAIQITLGKSGK